MVSGTDLTDFSVLRLTKIVNFSITYLQFLLPACLKTYVWSYEINYTTKKDPVGQLVRFTVLNISFSVWNYTEIKN